MKTSVRVVGWALVATVAIGAAGCGDDPESEEEVDLGCIAGYEPNEENTSCVPVDEDPEPDPDPEPEPPGGPLPPPESPFTMNEDQLRIRTAHDQDGRLWLVEGVTSRERMVVLVDELFGGPTEPGTYEITEAETSYETCGLCVILQAGCQRVGSEVQCEYEFMPRAQGEVVLEALGEDPGDLVAGELRGLVFQEVEIGPEFRTTVVPGGVEVDLMTWRFEGPIEEGPQQPPEVCGGHGHRHGNHCHCDPGYRLDPTDPLNCIEA